MDINLLNEIYTLKDLLKDSEEYKMMKEKENIMNNDKDFLILSNAFINDQEEYKRLQDLKLDLKEITKKLSKSKETLYSLKVVKDYLEYYNKFQELLKEVSGDLLDGVFSDENC